MTHKRTLSKDFAHARWLQLRLQAGALYLHQLDKAFIERIKSERLSDGVSPASVNRILALVRSVLKRACDEWDWLERVPRIRLLPEAKRPERFLSREEARALLAELPPHLRAMVLFSLLTGLRQGNVRDLRWEWVDLDSRQVVIPSTRMKGGKPHAVALTDLTLQILSAQRGTHPERVFTYQGRPVEWLNTRAFRHALKRAGVENFRWHDLRHTFASWLAQDGVPLNVIQQLGGWAQPSMVQRYAHLQTQHQQPFLKTLGARLEGA